MKSKVTRDGFDRIGPFHPVLVWAGILVFDLVVILLVLLALTKLGDKVEDVVTPGGEEWVTF